MSTLDVIRAWKDEEYRASLRESEIVLLPAHPAGAVELPLDDLTFAGANENPLSFPGACTCIGICPYTQDMRCGNTVDFLGCTFLLCPPWFL
jgi:mersacidin/lichenicidin family type 2 lantibiotic